MPNITRGQLNEALALQLHRELANPTHAAQITIWRNLALAKLEMVEAWVHLRKLCTLDLTVNIYAYDFPTDYGGRLDADSITYGTSAPLEFFQQATEVDRSYGPEWKRTAHAGGSPEYATYGDGGLWLIPKPNANFMSAYGYVDYYYYRNIDGDNSVSVALDADDDTTELWMPIWMLPYAIRAAEIYSLRRQDNSDFARLMSEFDKIDVPDLRAFNPAPKSYEPNKRPILGRRQRRRSGY